MSTDLDADIQRRLLRKHGLRYGALDDLTVERRRRGRGFAYFSAGEQLRQADILERIRGLAVPPAWREVRIAPEPALHLQAFGLSPAKRQQYLYHPLWPEVREAVKLRRLKRFCKALPGIRTRVDRDLRASALTPDFVCAAAVRLIDLTEVRIGSWTHTRLTGARGATTLLRSDVEPVGPGRARLSFLAKGGKDHEADIDDRRLARILHRLAEHPGKHLFDVAIDDERFRLTADRVNAYLREAGGQPVSGKDFRTFDACAEAVGLLAVADVPSSERARRRKVMEVARHVAGRLGNTPAMARSSYIHRRIIEAWERNELSPRLVGGRRRAKLTTNETALARLLDRQ